MKLKNGFIMRTIAGKDIILPSGDELNLNAMITLNETGKFIWQHLEQETTEEQIVNDILTVYDVSREDAAKCVNEFIEKLRSYDFIE